MKILKWVGIAAAVLVLMLVFKSSLVHAAVEFSLSKALHVPVHVSSVKFSLSQSSVELKNFRVQNPHNFPEKMMLECPEIFVALDPADLRKGKIHLRDVRLNLKQLTVIRNKDGQLNVNALKPAETKKKAESKKAPELQIDKLHLTIGQVVYKDYSSGTAQTQVFDIGMQDREYKNIQSPAAVASLIMFEALTRTSLARLSGLDLGMFKDTAFGAFSQSLGLVGSGKDTVEQTAKDLLKMFK